MKNRTTIIQDLINEHNLNTYLEIGVQENANSSIIKAKYKFGVDINVPKDNSHFDAFYHGKSKDFFAQNKQRFDLIFIDGDHTFEGAWDDLMNSLEISDGFIVMHDALPEDEEATRWPNNTKYGTYNGEVYKCLLALHDSGNPYHLHPEDHGVLVIKVSDVKKDLFKSKKYSWDDLIMYKKEKLYSYKAVKHELIENTSMEFPKGGDANGEIEQQLKESIIEPNKIKERVTKAKQEKKKRTRKK